MRNFSDNNSTSSENSAHSKKTNYFIQNSKLNKILYNINFETGYWVQSENVTKKGPEIFIKDLNRCTSYYPKKKNHTFTDVFYIQDSGYSLIHFLNEKLASQFFSEKEGVNWLGQIEDEEDDDVLELIMDDSDNDKESEIRENDESLNYEFYRFELNDKDGENFCYAKNEEEKILGGFIPCRNKKAKITSPKKIFFKIFKWGINKISINLDNLVSLWNIIIFCLKILKMRKNFLVMLILIILCD